MPLIDLLPRVNATLNGVAGVLLLCGLYLIKRRNIEAHRKVMIGAFVMSSLFLVSYVTYHTLRQQAEGIGHTKWVIDGWMRPTYYTILLTHIVLAAFVPFLAIRTLWLGSKRQDARHRRLARWTWPIWMYVSVTGVIVYAMLYEVQPRLRSDDVPLSVQPEPPTLQEP